MMQKKQAGSAMMFIFLMGVVSLFGDMTYEGARSLYGNYLTLLGASAAVIGFVTGFGELVGYSLRWITGMIANRTGQYWPMTIAGYAVNIVAIPCLALVPQDGWLLAAFFIVLERVGKAVRQPAKNTLLSFAASQNGVGKGFAIQEFMDQIGAFLGPVLLFAVVALREGMPLLDTYAVCFAVLGIPAFCCTACVLRARKKFPNPECFEPVTEASPAGFHWKKPFIGYLAAISLFAFGFMDFPLITMHAARTGLLSDDALPLLYAGAMLVDAVAALFFGWLYDSCGLKVLMFSALLAAPFAYFVFTAQSAAALCLGVALWGIGMGAQESIFKAAVSSMIPAAARSTGFGIFETVFGVAWFAGSCLLGALYDQSLPLMILISCGLQLLAVPVLFYTWRTMAG